MTSEPSHRVLHRGGGDEAGRPMIPAPRLVGHAVLDRHGPAGLRHGEVGAGGRRDADRRRRRQPFAAADRARLHFGARQQAQQAIVRLAHAQDACSGRQDLVLLVGIQHPAGGDIEHEVGRLHRREDQWRRRCAPHRPFEVVRHRRLDDLARLRAEVLRGRQEGRRILRVGQRVRVDDDAFAARHVGEPQSFAEQRHEVRRDVGGDRKTDHGLSPVPAARATRTDSSCAGEPLKAARVDPRIPLRRAMPCIADRDGRDKPGHDGQNRFHRAMPSSPRSST